MSKMTNTELWELYLNGEYDNLDLDDLKKVERLVGIRGSAKENKVKEPTPKIQVEADAKYSGDNESLHSWYNEYTKDFEVPKENNQIYKAYFENTDADSGCEDNVDAWSPLDSYAKAIWYGVLCETDLFGVCVNNVKIDKGQGLTVQIRVAGNFGDPSEKGSCECASCSSIAYTTYPLTLKQYNLESVICDRDVWDVGEVEMEATIESMKRSWTRWFNSQIYTTLTGASGHRTETLANALNCSPGMAGSCCSDTAFIDLYNSIENAVAVQRAAGYDPDYLVVAPSVAKVLKSVNQGAVPLWASREFTFGADGKMTHGAGLKVIEYCSATACTNATGEVMALVIDSKRVIGSAFGQKPKMYNFFKSDCNAYRIDFWAYWACGILDASGLTKIVNP